MPNTAAHSEHQGRTPLPMAGLVGWLALGTLLLTGTAAGAEKESRSEQILGWNSLVQLVERLNLAREVKSQYDYEQLVLGLHIPSGLGLYEIGQLLVGLHVLRLVDGVFADQRRYQSEL